MSTSVSATTDRISLIGLSARGHHGVLPFEREEGQLFTVDVVLDLGARGTAVAAVTDSVTDAVDYSRVANGIVSIIEGEPVNLIESLADRIAERVLSFPRVVAAEVTVHKPEAPLDVAFEDVSVTIHRVADAAAGHGGSPATSQAAWAAQASQTAEPAATSALSSSPASPVAAASPAASVYESPAATPTVALASESPDLPTGSIAESTAAAAAAPVSSTPGPPITPTPSPASPLEAPARSPFAAAAPSVPTPFPAEPAASGGAASTTQSWVPDWATDSSSPSSSQAHEVPAVSESPEASAVSDSYSVAADASAAAGLLDGFSTSAPTAASAGRTAGADGFVSLAADAMGMASAAPEAQPEPAGSTATGEPEGFSPSSPFEPAASSHADEPVAGTGAPEGTDSAAGRLPDQMPREGRHVASSEDVEQQAAPIANSPVDILGEPGSYNGSSLYSGSGYSGTASSEETGEMVESPFSALSGSDAADSVVAGGLGGVPASQPPTDPGPFAPGQFSASSAQPVRSASSPFPAPGEYLGAASQESTLSSYSDDASSPSAPVQSGFPGLAASSAPPADPLAERPGRPVGVVFGLGANVGGVVESLRTAVQSLRGVEGIEVTQVAPLARTVATVAEGAEPQPDYLNTVVTALTTLSPRELLEVCHALEDAAGRVRTEPWGVRTLDVDLIEVEGVTSADPELSLPHPHAAERAFVLVPWSQADPFAELAGHSVSELAENAPDRGGLRWLAFDWLDSDSLPDKPTGPYVEPPVEQAADGAEPEPVYDATRDESPVVDAGSVPDYLGSISGSSPGAAGPVSSAQPLDAQAPVEQAPFDSSYDSSPWSGQAPQFDSPYRAASAPEASGASGGTGVSDSQGGYAPGRITGVGGFPGNQQDVGSYADYAAGQQDQADPATQPQRNEAAGDAWRSPLQWNEVIGGGAPGTGPRRDA